MKVLIALAITFAAVVEASPSGVQPPASTVSPARSIAAVSPTATPPDAKSLPPSPTPGATPSTAPPATKPPAVASSPPDRSADFYRTLAGAFVGAMAAFLFNLLLQYLLRRRDNLAAGNLALLVLSRQLSDLLVLAEATQDHRDGVLKADAKTPTWAQVHPGHFYFSEGLKFNFENLSFLLSKGDAKILSQLAEVEQRYFDLASLVERHAEALEAIQTKIADGKAQNWQWVEMEDLVGKALIAKANSLTGGILSRVARDPDEYQEAIDGLRTALLRRFDHRKVVSVKTHPKVVRLPQEGQ